MFYGQRVLDYDTPTCLRATRCDLNTDYCALRATEHSLVHGRAPPGIPLRDLATRNVLRAPTARVLNLEPYIPRFFDGAGYWTTASPRWCGSTTSSSALFTGAGSWTTSTLPRWSGPSTSFPTLLDGAGSRTPSTLPSTHEWAGPALHLPLFTSYGLRGPLRHPEDPVRADPACYSPTRTRDLRHLLHGDLAVPSTGAPAPPTTPGPAAPTTPMSRPPPVDRRAPGPRKGCRDPLVTSAPRTHAPTRLKHVVAYADHHTEFR